MTNLRSYSYTTAPESWSGTTIVVRYPEGREAEAAQAARQITPAGHPCLYGVYDITESTLDEWVRTRSSISGTLYVYDVETERLAVVIPRGGASSDLRYLSYENLSGPYRMEAPAP